MRWNIVIEGESEVAPAQIGARCVAELKEAKHDLIAARLNLLSQGGYVNLEEVKAPEEPTSVGATAPEAGAAKEEVGGNQLEQ